MFGGRGNPFDDNSAVDEENNISPVDQMVDPNKVEIILDDIEMNFGSEVDPQNFNGDDAGEESEGNLSMESDMDGKAGAG